MLAGKQGQPERLQGGVKAYPTPAQLRTCLNAAVLLAAAAAPAACLASELPTGYFTAPTHTSSRLACRAARGAC